MKKYTSSILYLALLCTLSHSLLPLNLVINQSFQYKQSLYDQLYSTASPEEALESEPDLVFDPSIKPQHISSLPKETNYVMGVSSRAGPLNEAVAMIANITLAAANSLVDVGAVWARMETLNEEDILRLYDEKDNITSTSRAMYADVVASASTNKKNDQDIEAYLTRMQQQRFRRILQPSWIEAGTDLRIYVKPRRFPSCYDLTKSNLLYEDTTFLVVDKPPMLPTQPDASNYHECLPGCVQKRLGPFYDIDKQIIARLLLCHRVDACVGGCVVLSKTRHGQKVFCAHQRDRTLRKVYLAVTTNPVPLGLHIHWMWAPQSSRGKLGGPPCQLIGHRPPSSRKKARQFWRRCVLEVVSCEGGMQIKGKKETTYFQSTIRLVTGRKHQVRAQLASLGAPILDDTLYEPMSGLTLDDDESLLDAALVQCRAPTAPIGLQAHGILMGNVRVKAREPWWQQK